jgi:hypothetical protein
MKTATFLFTDCDKNTTGMLVADLEDGSIQRHAVEGQKYERIFMLLPQTGMWEELLKSPEADMMGFLEALLLFWRTNGVDPFVCDKRCHHFGGNCCHRDEAWQICCEIPQKGVENSGDKEACGYFFQSDIPKEG